MTQLTKEQEATLNRLTKSQRELWERLTGAPDWQSLPPKKQAQQLAWAKLPEELSPVPFPRPKSEFQGQPAPQPQPQEVATEEKEPAKRPGVIVKSHPSDRVCTKCNRAKPETDFLSPRRRGYTLMCNTCRTYMCSRQKEAYAAKRAGIKLTPGRPKLNKDDPETGAPEWPETVPVKDVLVPLPNERQAVDALAAFIRALQARYEAQPSSIGTPTITWG